MCLGIPGQIVELVDEHHHIAKAEVSGVRRNINVGLLADGPDAVGVGDWVLIHVGFAMSKIDEEEARQTREFLVALGEPFEQELAELRERNRMNASVAGARLERVIATRRAALESLVETDAERIAHACHEMARRFARGGTLVTFGVEAAATDAAHATVEFMHPVIVGKRALPAIAPTNEPTRIADPARLVGGDDIALGIAHGPLQPQVEDFLAKSQARER